jgi:hypothetical protein
VTVVTSIVKRGKLNSIKAGNSENIETKGDKNKGHKVSAL